jgi:hypothetical protein
VRQSNRLSAKIINRSTVCAFLPEHLQGICCASVSSHTPGGKKGVCPSPPLHLYTLHRKPKISRQSDHSLASSQTSPRALVMLPSCSVARVTARSIHNARTLATTVDGPGKSPCEVYCMRRHELSFRGSSEEQALFTLMRSCNGPNGPWWHALASRCCVRDRALLCPPRFLRMARGCKCLEQVVAFVYKLCQTLIESENYTPWQSTSGLLI